MKRFLCLIVAIFSVISGLAFLPLMVRSLSGTDTLNVSQTDPQTFGMRGAQIATYKGALMIGSFGKDFHQSDQSFLSGLHYKRLTNKEMKDGGVDSYYLDKKDMGMMVSGDLDPSTRIKDYRLMGFQFFRYVGPVEEPFYLWQVIVPLWFLAPIFGIVSYWQFQKYRVLSRNKAGHCPTCNYDLRESRVRCPECGTEVKQ